MKKLWAALIASWLVIAGMVYLFFIKGSVEEASDGRTAVVVTQAEKDFVLAEMRGFLEAVQAIVAALGTNDMPAVSAAAKKVGMGATHNVPGSLMRKLPLEFKQLGMPTHKLFDKLSLEASGLGEKQEVINQLGSLMNNCVTCHAGYRLEVEHK